MTGHWLIESIGGSPEPNPGADVAGVHKHRRALAHSHAYTGIAQPHKCWHTPTPMPTHTHTRTRTHTQTQARAHAHMHAHTHARTHAPVRDVHERLGLGAAPRWREEAAAHERVDADPALPTAGVTRRKQDCAVACLQKDRFSVERRGRPKGTNGGKSGAWSGCRAAARVVAPAGRTRRVLAVPVHAGEGRAMRKGVLRARGEPILPPLRVDTRSGGA